MSNTVTALLEQYEYVKLVFSAKACFKVVVGSVKFREAIVFFVDSYYRMEGNFGGCKLWQINKENFIGGINFGELSLNKHILKQFEDTSVPNLSIRVRVCARMAVLSPVESMIRGYHEYKLIWNDPIL